MPSQLLRTDQVTIGGVPTRAVRADGDPGKVRYLFLHGFSDSADCWQRVQKRLLAAQLIVRHGRGDLRFESETLRQWLLEDEDPA